VEEEGEGGAGERGWEDEQEDGGRKREVQSEKDGSEEQIRGCGRTTGCCIDERSRMGKRSMQSSQLEFRCISPSIPSSSATSSSPSPPSLSSPPLGSFKLTSLKS